MSGTGKLMNVCNTGGAEGTGIVAAEGKGTPLLEGSLRQGARELNFTCLRTLVAFLVVPLALRRNRCAPRNLWWRSWRGTCWARVLHRISWTMWETRRVLGDEDSELLAHWRLTAGRRAERSEGKMQKLRAQRQADAAASFTSAAAAVSSTGAGAPGALQRAFPVKPGGFSQKEVTAFLPPEAKIGKQFSWCTRWRVSAPYQS